MLEIFQYSFMIRAFIGGLIIAVIAPSIGHFLVMRRFSLIADTLSHVALAGVAIGLLTHTQPLITTLVLTVAASLAIEKVRSSQHLSGETILSMFLPGGLALSVVLLSLANGFNSNLFSYLFGSITTVRSDELLMMLGLGIVTVSSIGVLYKKLLYAAFDEESAQVSGVPVKLINSVLLILTAITVSLAMRVVGVLLIGALMTIPVVASMQVARSFRESIFVSVIFAALSVVSGLFLAYYLNIPAGGVIVLVALAIFLITAAFKK
jgi:zinc transport system permease protein